jgi:peptide/nickel transport system substrate-binding protein
MTPPGIIGHDPQLNPYPSGDDNTGNIAKAKQELKKCGKPDGFSTKFAYATPATHEKKAFTFEQQALERVGIDIEPATDDGSSYHSTFVGSPKTIKDKGLGIAILGWQADFPTGYGFYDPIVNGDNVRDVGNTNVVGLDDPAINKILSDAPAGKAYKADWKKLDRQLMADAVYLPIYWGKNLYYRNPRLTNITCNNALAFGIYDWVNVGVAG